MGPPSELVDALKTIFKLNCFVETGTLHGDTTIWASDRFETVYTLEASQDLFNAAQSKFASRPNIKSLQGDSGASLHKILPDLPPSLFFLDAHWSGGVTAGEESECPVLTELALIMPWFRKHAVLIDDARLFLAPPPSPHRSPEWPSIDQIVNATAATAYMSLYRDVLVLVPQAYRPVVSSALQTLVPG